MNGVRRLSKALPPTAAIAAIGWLQFSYADASCNTLIEQVASRAKRMNQQFRRDLGGHNFALADEGNDEGGEQLTNWSGTHTITLSKVHAPETVEELANIVQQATEKIRPVGSALSPNGLSFSPAGTSAVSMSLLDKIVKVDVPGRTVTVQAGCRVSQVVDHLRKHNLTLPNLASIAEQQIGGFVNAGAHGTGATVTPVDDFVVSMKLVTPAFGEIEVSNKDSGLNKLVFDMCRVGLGAFGIASEYTLRCIPSHHLLEHTIVLTRAEAVRMLPEMLKSHKHMRYMWIPYVDGVVVVSNDPFDCQSKDLPKSSPFDGDALEPFKVLLKSHPKNTKDECEIDSMGMGDLRDNLLDLDPLSTPWVKRVNEAEHEFWKNSQGYRYLPSDRLLQFECGGQQWVQEVCFPTGSLYNLANDDMNFMLRLLDKIESRSLPAPAPIEQRWSASSTSLMSPANTTNHPHDTIFSWVGIIMYLTTDEPERREAITKEFQTTYRDLLEEVGDKNGIVTHWAKIELPPKSAPDYDDRLDKLRRRLRERYPIDQFNALRKLFDPRNVCGNDLIDALLATEPKRKR